VKHPPPRFVGETLGGCEARHGAVWSVRRSSSQSTSPSRPRTSTLPTMVARRCVSGLSLSTLAMPTKAAVSQSFGFSCECTREVRPASRIMSLFRVRPWCHPFAPTGCLGNESSCLRPYWACVHHAHRRVPRVDTWPALVLCGIDAVVNKSKLHYRTVLSTWSHSWPAGMHGLRQYA